MIPKNHPKYGNESIYSISGPHEGTNRFRVCIWNRETHIQIKGMNYARFLMECHLQRELEINEIVHHIDGNKLNDVIENLRVMKNDEHARQHTMSKPETFKCFHCKQTFTRYGPLLSALKRRIKKNPDCPIFCDRSCSISWRNKHT